jgi:hypothetical protein
VSLKIGVKETDWPKLDDDDDDNDDLFFVEVICVKENGYNM